MNPVKYKKRGSLDGLWEVYDPEAGDIVVMGGMLLSGLSEHEADEAIELLAVDEIGSDQPINSRAGPAGA